MNKGIIHLLSISLIKGVGSAFIKNRLNEIDNYINDINLLGTMLGGKVTLETIQENIPMAKKIIDDCNSLNIKIVPIFSNKYPSLLKEIKTPPPLLYLKGNINNLNKCVAIIGTRKSDKLGNIIASKVGNYFSNNWSICNGLVDGIDKNAIQSENSFYKNVTGVLSGGLNYQITSSKTTQQLAELVLLNDGLLVSENPPNKKEDQFSGSKASRIQAGLSKGLLLIQSSIDGGSKYTIKAFSELKRPIGVIDFSGNKNFDDSLSFSGNKELLQNGNLGIASMCKINKITSIKTTYIISIANKNDYQLYEKEL